LSIQIVANKQAEQEQSEWQADTAEVDDKDGNAEFDEASPFACGDEGSGIGDEQAPNGESDEDGEDDAPRSDFLHFGMVAYFSWIVKGNLPIFGVDR
jgi:hypothetical protein